MFDSPPSFGNPYPKEVSDFITITDNEKLIRSWFFQVKLYRLSSNNEIGIFLVSQWIFFDDTRESRYFFLSYISHLMGYNYYKAEDQIEVISEFFNVKKSEDLHAIYIKEKELVNKMEKD